MIRFGCHGSPGMFDFVSFASKLRILGDFGHRDVIRVRIGRVREEQRVGCARG